MQNIPGGDTGLMKRTVKSIGFGASATIIEEFEFDAALSKQYLAVLEQAAKEMGDRFEEAKPNGDPGDRPKIIINHPVLRPEDLKASAWAPTLDMLRLPKRYDGGPSR
jgi:cytochrome c556